MSQLNVNQGIPRYSIEQFQQIAKNSRDNQELRIRVSNQQLTNTSLGCLASIFKHKESNTQVNRAFMQSILTDNRYQCVAKQIHTALSTTMPEQEALTPAKIKTALSTANSILRAHKDGVEIANRMCNIDVLPQNMVNEFASFYTNYVADNPDIKIDTQDFGSKNLLTAAERKLPDRARESARQDAEGKRIRPLGEMIKEFYLEGDRVERSGFFKYQPSDCANDPAKADALNKLFAENSADIPNLKTPKSINDALQGCFDTGNLGRIPSSGSIFSLWKGDLHRRFCDLAFTTTRSNDNKFAFCRTADIEYLRQNAPTNATNRERSKWLETISRGLNKAFTIHPEWTKPGHEQEISDLLKHLCQVAKNDQGKSLSTDLANKTFLEHDVLLNVESKPINDLCKNMGLNSVGVSALKTQEFVTQTAQKAKELDTEAEIAQMIQQEAKTFLETNKGTLDKLEAAASGFKQKECDTLLRIGMPLLNLLEKMDDAKGSDVNLLRQANLVANRFFAEDLDDAGRGKILNSIVDTFTAGKTVDEKMNLCQNNKGRMERFLGELSSIKAKQDTTPAVHETCDRTKTLLQGLYTQLLNRLPDQDDGMFLNPHEAKAPNPNLAKQMEPIRSGTGQIIRNVDRNATSGEIFTTLKELEKADAKEAKIYIPLVEQTRCTDVKLLKEIYNTTTSDITRSMGSIHSDGDYASDMKHYFNDIFTVGETIVRAAEKFPQYSSNDISTLFADVFIATHTDEELAKTLEGLQSGESKLALNVIFNHANKESLALQGQSSYKLDTAYSALGALDQIQSKIAQKLHRPAPDSIFKNFTPDKTLRDLPLQDQLDVVMPDQFPTHLGNLDRKLFMSKDRLNDADYSQLKNFVSQLKLPDNTTVGAGKNESEFAATYTDASGEKQEDNWNIDNLSSIFASNARKVSNLLKESNGRPSAAQLWNVLHGGRPPASLNMDNFAEKLMEKINQEVHDFRHLTGGREMPISEFVHLCDTAVGMPVGAVIDKLSHAGGGDVTFTAQDQVMENGFFSVGSSSAFANGQEIYGFGLDFHRAQMPMGALQLSDEGCKITVVANGKEKVFTQQAYKEFNEANQLNKDTNPTINHPYMKDMIDTIEPLCQNKAQLAGVGLCTTQNIQMSLRNIGYIYKNVTGGTFEHTALDHRIEQQNDGTIKVNVKEKPGSLFKLDMELSVAVNGEVTLNRGSFTVPSIAKWNENAQA